MTTMKFYHINREVPWVPYQSRKVGDAFCVGAEENPFFQHYSNYSPRELVNQNGETVKVPAVAFLRQVKEGLIQTNDLPTIAFQTAEYFQMFLREVWWECVRLQEFPQLPSRQRCLWLIPDLAGVDFWLERLHCHAPYQVLTVEAEGIFHTANEKYLTGDAVLLPEMRERARLYWKGVMPHDGMPEVLFEGAINVVEIDECRAS